jgi:hypothetical protein
MTREKLNQFLSERPSLTLEGLSREGGKSRKALKASLPESGEISPKILSWLMPVLNKYGWLNNKGNEKDQTGA